MTIKTGNARRPEYLPIAVAGLGKLMSGADQSRRWRLAGEFLEDYRHEPVGTRFSLLAEEPRGTGTSDGMSSLPGPGSILQRWTGALPRLGLISARRGNCGSRSTRVQPVWMRSFTRPRRSGATACMWPIRGAAMALAYDSRRSTRAIDAVFQPHGTVVEEARAVAAELGLPAWWLNEQASAYVAPGGDAMVTRPWHQ